MTLKSEASNSFNPHQAPEKNAPAPKLKMIDAVAVIIGIVVGAGIFRTPSIIAANTQDTYFFLGSWLLGGIISLIGALCYAELTTTFPNAGGDYYFLRRAFGQRLSFLFAWARMSIIQTGSIALLAYIVGDYTAQIYDIGPYSSAIYASIVVISLTAINIIGINFGTSTQKLLTLIEVVGILMIVFSGLFFSSPATPSSIQETTASASTPSFGLALVFVLLTFGGWNEAAYISAELQSGRKKMAGILIWSIVSITIIYLLINLAYLKILGLEGIASTDAVGAQLMRSIYGEYGAVLISILVVIAALTSANATIFTGARTNYALGRDFNFFKALGRWNQKTSSPINALLIQALISLALIGLGLFTRSGFETIIDYTAPVFWFFFLLVGIALFILRIKEPHVKRPFRVPLYPITPIIFCTTSTYLLYSSLAYTGIGAFVGVIVLIIGGILLLTMPLIKKGNNIV
ncbi:amino acid permease [Olivibacter sp. SDN3]|uniref:APC family permease n=1 Tax=Olivibacter sp. SDN3 TaxID=2764720 RepID=UPI001650F642|nr:amino acid permease [Olivibacter sp. SDN3]QNL50792.1 amino acid permease [Olivibacter sp. SDN3]